MKCLVTILFVLLSISFVAEHVLLKHANDGLALVQDDSADNSSEEERQSKVEDDIKVQYVSMTAVDLPVPVLLNDLPVSYYYALLSSGYINKPYTPPDFN